LYKEQPGYILNSLLVPLLIDACVLWANEVADHKTIDKTWIVSTGAPAGPFGFIDVIGITTAYNVSKMQVEKTNDPILTKAVKLLKENFIDTGKLGIATGEGFYKYPNPEYTQPDFLK
jgi:3-hydroxyacyl-CoA dehydrogenase